MTGKPAVPPDDKSGELRREALKKMGRYAAYTAPALLALLAAKKAHASS